MAEHLVSFLAPNSGVAVIGGPHSVDDAEEVAGLAFAIQQSHCKLLNDPTEPQYCNLTDIAVGAREPMSRLLAEFPRIDGLIPYNDETMHGALACVEEAGRAKEMKIVCRNGSPVAVEAVRQGKIAGTWDLDASGIGTTLGEVIVRHLTKERTIRRVSGMSPVGRMIMQDESAHLASVVRTGAVAAAHHRDLTQKRKKICVSYMSTCFRTVRTLGSMLWRMASITVCAKTGLNYEP